MLNVNFVPDDYVQTKESRRVNLVYLVLFGLVMAALAGSFATIKTHQRAVRTQEELLNKKMVQAQEAIRQFEELQEKRKVMLKTALTTADLLEPVPRSVLLASLTNNLPPGASFLSLHLIQKEGKKPTPAPAAAPTTKFDQAQAQKTEAQQPKISPEKLLETYMEIEGLAPSDLQVAAYIEQLSNSALLDNVALVESKEYKIEDSTLRRFKLTAMLSEQVHLTLDDVEAIKARAKGALPSLDVDEQLPNIK
jgi:Tfp pilus assembly protein PilN